MKLYPEEQVRLLLNEILMLSSSVDDAIDSLTPIELPSDEEIKEKSNKRWWKGATPPSSFNEGAKWVIEQIKQQDNVK